MKKEFPFGWALFVALLVHTFLGIFLKQNPLLIAATAPSPVSRAPMKMHFVESPPDAKVAPVKPNTSNLSDADRKAGPLKKSEKLETKSTQYAKPAQRQKSESNDTERMGSKRAELSSLPAIEQPSLPRTGQPGDYRIPSNTDPKKLSESLENLDQFIGSWSGSDSRGDLPSGDSGSGVFFDTQGFDLGPWANRVVAMVRSNWIVPVAAELGVKGIVGVSFQVERTGRIINIRVISPSGTPSFDQAAVNALKTSNPFPALPADFPRPILPGVFRFYYNLPVPGK
ncbi:TonB C-terminal domain-containing protein [bacterium]|nr:TonB C-terminal domain-containing protein [bacterium]MCI0606458.1 TonB C-terminal domain-containing protein [bacterium]